MAEAGTQSQQGTQGAAGQAGAANGQPQGQAQGQAQGTQEPKWLSYIQDQAEREEAKKGWMLEADYRKKTSELAEQRKQWESEQQRYKDIESKHNAYDKWWKEFEPTYQTLTKNWDKIQSVLNGQAVQQTQQTQSQQNGQSSQNYFENWDVLPPEEQARRIAEYNQSALTQGIQSFEQKMLQTIAQKEQQLQNYLAILTDAYGRKFQDPTLDIPSYIKKATEFSYGQFNPMDLAYSALTDGQKLEKMKEEWLAKGREEGKLEASNQQQSTGAFNNQGVTQFRTAPKSPQQVREAVRELAIQKGFGWGS